MAELDGVVECLSRIRLASDSQQRQEEAVSAFSLLAGVVRSATDRASPLHSDVVDSMCDVAKQASGALTTDEFLARCHADFLSLLVHAPRPLSISLVSLLADRAERDVKAVCEGGVALLVGALRLVAADSCSSTDARRLIVAIAGDDEGARRFWASEPLVHEISAQLSATDASTRVRVYDLVAEVCAASAQGLAGCVREGWLDALVGELARDDDVLVQLNALETLAKLNADAAHVKRHLFEQGVAARLCTLLAGVRQSPEGAFLFVALVRFFGYTAHEHPAECCVQYPLFVDIVCELAAQYESLDDAQRLLVFDTVAVVASSVAGKLALLEYSKRNDDSVDSVMGALGAALQYGPITLRVRHLEALCTIFAVSPTDTATEGERQLASEALHRWFSRLAAADDSASMAMLFGMFKQVIPEVHCAAGSVFVALASQPWATALMARQAGFVEYLLDRKRESAMDGRNVTFDIVGALLDCAAVDEAFGADAAGRLRQFRVDGPLFVAARHQLASLEC